MTEEAPASVPWYKDKAILLAITPIVGAALKLVQVKFGAWISANLGLAVNSWTAEDVMTYVAGIAGMVSGVYFLRRRIRSGKDPRNPAPLVTGGPVAQTLIGATATADDLVGILNTPPPVGHKTREQLLADAGERWRRFENLPPPIKKADG